jgi:uncharacterized protein YjbJ (UPF0337 family)
MTTDRAKGKGKEALGAGKQAAGRATGNRKLEAQGKDEKVKGKAQDAMGKGKRAAKDLKEKVT